jgi:hypothetical protein
MIMLDPPYYRRVFVIQGSRVLGFTIKVVYLASVSGDSARNRSESLPRRHSPQVPPMSSSGAASPPRGTVIRHYRARQNRHGPP